MGNCKHWQDRVHLGKGELWLSGSKNETTSKNRETPDLAVFLETAWVRILNTELVVRGSLIEGFPPKGEVIFIPWKDFGTYNQGRFTSLVNLAASYLQAGKTVEVGCMGGHGRTGTFVAGLLVKVEGLKARAAITEVRFRYCREAVETEGQEKMIFQLTREKFVGAPLPKKSYSKTGADLVDPEFDYLDSNVTKSKHKGKGGTEWWGSNSTGAAPPGFDLAKSRTRDRLRITSLEELDTDSEDLEKQERFEDLLARLRLVGGDIENLMESEREELETLECWELSARAEALIQDVIPGQDGRQYVVCKKCGQLTVDPNPCLCLENIDSESIF